MGAIICLAVELSVVIPVYGCAGCLTELHARLTLVVRNLGVSYELLFVDDRDPGGSWILLEELAERDPHVRALRLSRNFGQHAAITAGLAQSRGRWTVVMDCDLQNPPEEISRLYARANEGFEVVYGRRITRQHPWFRRAASAAYFWILNALVGTSLSGDYDNFSIISARVRDTFLEVQDADRHYLMILNWLGFTSTTVDVRHAPRLEGESTYTFRALLQFAIAGLFFQTTTVLRWITYLGFGISAVGGGLAIFFLVNRFAVQHPYPGWTSLAVLLLLLGGFIIVATGVTGLYIGKIFTQVKQRPLYVVENDTGAVDSPSLLSRESEDRATGAG